MKKKKAKPVKTKSTKKKFVAKEKVEVVPVVEAVVENKEVEKEFSAGEIISSVVTEVNKLKVNGYVFSVADSTGKIIPFVSASSIGDLLTIKWAIDKEIERIIDLAKNKIGDSASPSQQQ